MFGRLRPSRTIVLAALAIITAFVAYLAVTGAATLLLVEGGVHTTVVTFVVPLVCALVAGVVLPSPRTRGWLKVTLAKHLFAHRYDYRAEWLRFSQMLGRANDSAEPLEQRVIRALAGITDSGGGVLLLPDEDGLGTRFAWDWAGAQGRCDTVLRDLLAEDHIVALDEFRARDDGRMPEWLLSDPRAWAVVPLMHFDRLAGAVVLARPALDRGLDWEDFDLLRVAGRSAASTLQEARSQESLAELQRFEEFNRRFAFIMHDIKNLVSQLSLVARNAERHADKPEFRRDMVATLNSSTARMNELLARLSQHHKGRHEACVPVPLMNIVAAVAAERRAIHPVVIEGGIDELGIADPARLETVIVHLVQNAIEASPPHEPVAITIAREGRRVSIAVTDRGAGMTAEFVRTQLYRPFSSTKAGGFGIGAYEARCLVTAMGGNLEVETAPGSGSRFTIWLPAVERPALAA